MVVIKELINKEGEILKTKEGVILKDYLFEIGDEFVPQINKVIEKSREVEVQKKKKTITEYSIFVKVNDVNNKISSTEPIYIKLTPTQAKSLKDKIKEFGENKDYITQHLFSVYKYTSKQYGEQIGVGIKGNFPKPKDFTDFTDEVIKN